MKILITGGGRLAGELAPLLSPRHEIHLFDSRKVDLPFTLHRGDIRRAKDVFAAVAGMDAVIHSAGIFGLHLRTHDTFDFHQINVGGTLHVLEAMVRHRVGRLVFASSAAVYGWSKKGNFIVDEDTPCRPDNFYGLTKLLGENMCRYYSDKYDFLKCACLRYTAFYELPKAKHGPALLYDRMDVRDAARATALALEDVSKGEGAGTGSSRFKVYLVSSRVPFAKEDRTPLRDDPMAVLERYYPGIRSLAEKYKLEIPAIEAVYDISRARKELGYEPQHDFAGFLDQLRRGGLGPGDYESPKRSLGQRIENRLREIWKRYRQWRLG